MPKRKVEVKLADTSLIKYDPSDYRIMTADKQKVLQVIDLNLGNQKITVSDFDRIKVPAGGGIHYEVPGLTGPDMKKELDGIVLFWKSPRAYWQKEFKDSGGDTPPDCFSDDGMTGTCNVEGLPLGGPCEECPMSAWNSKQGSKAQACKEMRLIFLLMPKLYLPVTLAVPPTSIVTIKKHFLRMASFGVSYYEHVHRFTLLKDQNAQGIPYSKIEVVSQGEIAPDLMPNVLEYRDKMLPYIHSIRVKPEDMKS